tara:strand:- start:1153 stop:1503 length:351 start_codon:yes stop_codon:yes gene_type:complete
MRLKHAIAQVRKQPLRDVQNQGDIAALAGHGFIVLDRDTGQLAHSDVLHVPNGNKRTVGKIVGDIAQSYMDIGRIARNYGFRAGFDYAINKLKCVVVLGILEYQMAMERDNYNRRV